MDFLGWLAVALGRSQVPWRSSRGRSYKSDAVLFDFVSASVFKLAEKLDVLLSVPRVLQMLLIQPRFKSTALYTLESAAARRQDARQPQ